MSQTGHWGVRKSDWSDEAADDKYFHASKDGSPATKEPYLHLASAVLLSTINDVREYYDLSALRWLFEPAGALHLAAFGHSTDDVINNLLKIGGNYGKL